MKKNTKRILALVLMNMTILSSVFTPAVIADQTTIDETVEVEGDSIEQPEQIHVVYVMDEGSDANDGSDSKNAFASLSKAYAALSETGGVVVVCGKVTIYDESATLPAHDKDITLTSVFEGVDYRSRSDAEISYKNTLNIVGSGKTEITGIRLHSQSQANIFCNGSNVVFGTRVDNISDDGTFPSLWGGRMMTSSNVNSDGDFSDFTLEIDGGHWNHATLGNYRTGKFAPISKIKNASLIINGGTYIAKDEDKFVSSLVSGADATGSLNLEINGGIFYGSFYVIGDEGPVSPYLDFKYTADITVNITNGFFMGEYIKALYNPNASLYGTYNFSILSGSFSSLTYIGCEGVYSDITLTSCDAVQSKLYGFEKTVYVDALAGDDKNSGENPQSPKKTLSNAITSLIHGGTVVLCSEYNLPDGFIMTYNNSPIKITASDYNTDFGQINGAKIVIEGSVNVQSSIIFENITLSAPATATLLCAGELVEFSNNTVVEGDITVRLLESTDPHRLNIHSGNFTLVEIGASDSLTIFTMTGGTVGTLSSCSEEFHGDIFFDLSGGEIKSNYTICQNSISGNVQFIVGNIILGGTITAPTPAEGYVCEALILNNSVADNLIGFVSVPDKYFFVEDGGTGDGSTPSLAAPNTDAVSTIVGKENASVIISGKYTHSLPKADLSVGVNTYTSIYRGINFANINNASMTLASDFYFYNDATIKDITVITNKPDMSFRCDSHIVAFGYGINCIPRYHTNSYYPSIYAAQSIPNYPYNTKGESVSDKITVMGGIWNNVYGSAATHINGSVIRGKLFGTEDLSVNCTIQISDGVIYGGVYASKMMKSDSDATVLITFTGGEIFGKVSPSYIASTGFKGKYTVNITGGDFSGVEKFVDATFVGGEKSYANIHLDYDTATGYDNLSIYSNPISTGMSTLQYLDGYWYLFEANADKIIVWRSASIPSLYSNDPYATIETGSTIFDMSASILNGKIYIFIHNVFNQTHRTRVYSSKTTDGLTSFEFYTDIERPDILSPSLFSYDSQTYMYYSSESSDGGYDIYCVKLKDMLQFGTDPIKVLSATEKWEDSTLSTPRILTTPNGQYYLVYTGGDIYNGTSMIGVALVNNPADLLNSASYTKDKDPSLYSDSTHSRLIISSFIMIDGTEPYFTFSTEVNGESLLMMQSFSFDETDKPYLGVPCDINMLYQSYSLDQKLDDMLVSFEVNKTDNINTDGKIPHFKLKLEHIIILACGLGIIIVIVAIVLIRKFISNQNTSLRKIPKPDSKKLQRNQKRRRTGKLYASYLEQTENQNKDVAEENSETNSENTDENDSDDEALSEATNQPTEDHFEDIFINESDEPKVTDEVENESNEAEADADTEKKKAELEV